MPPLTSVAAYCLTVVPTATFSETDTGVVNLLVIVGAEFTSIKNIHGIHCTKSFCTINVFKKNIIHEMKGISINIINN